MRNQSNPVVFFDIVIDQQPRGRLVMELFRHVLPITVRNFLALCTHESGFGYRSSYFHRIIPGFMAQGGDFERSNGTGGYSIYGEAFNDEGFPYKHDRGALLSMANSGPNTNGSQFFITFLACPHLDNKHVVFGQVLQGFHILRDFEMSGTNDGEPTREVKIANTGQLQWSNPMAPRPLSIGPTWYFRHVTILSLEHRHLIFLRRTTFFSVVILSVR